MGIIKAGQVSESATAVRASVFNFEDMSHRAQDYVGEVQQRVQQVVEQARKEADQLRQKARQEGMQLARQEAEKKVRAELDGRWKSLEAAISEALVSFEQVKREWLVRWEQSAIRLAVAIAERLVRRELSQSPEITLSVIRESLEMACSSGQIKLRLHPQDHELLGAKVEQLIAQLSHMGSVEVLADSSLRPGSCCIDTQYGSIDQRLESQLARIEEELCS